MNYHIDWYGPFITRPLSMPLGSLKVKFGWQGLGRYWKLAALIASAPDKKLDLSLPKYINAAAYDLDLTAQQFREFIDFLMDPESCGELKGDGSFIWVNSETMQAR